MKAQSRPPRIRTITLLLTGVLPLAVQSGALAGRIAASRQVDRLVAELPSSMSVDDLVRLLSESSRARSESGDPNALSEDVVAVMIYCRIASLISDSAALQAPGLDWRVPSLIPPSVSRTVQRTPGGVDLFVLADAVARSVGRKLSDEQPLGP